ncbi:MAG: HEAT repeat domain-containing protein [Elusimicrobiales bacterium]|nr:HEAT repeat domain-containing protein [Elusimicrobiales bacterium]
MKLLIIFIWFSKYLTAQQEVFKSTEVFSPRYAVEILVKHIKSGDSDIKSYAIESISKTGETKLIPLLKKYLSDTNKYVIIATAKALWNLGDASGLSKLKEIIEQKPDFDITKNDPLTQLKIISTNKIREKAMATIAELEGIKAKNLLLDVKENDPFGQMRDAAARELAKIGYKNEMDTFLKALSSQDEEIRNQAAENLAKICPTESYGIIQALKKEKSIRIQINLLNSLRCANLSKKEEEEISKFIDSDNPTIKIKTIIILLNSSNPQIENKLKKIYEDTPDIITKLTILKKFSQNKNFKITCDEIDYLNSIEDSNAKRKFIEISNINLECSKKYLEKYINDSDPYVSIDAAVKIIEIVRKK